LLDSAMSTHAQMISARSRRPSNQEIDGQVASCSPRGDAAARTCVRSCSLASICSSRRARFSV
jgi:hypothetical protein